MPIKITEFGGTIPRMNPEKLPDAFAQEAFNCDLTSGALAPLRTSHRFVSMHNGDLTLKAGIPAKDVISITKPNPPTVNTIEKLAHPENWLRIFASDWVSYTDVGGIRRVIRARAQMLPIIATFYTEVEMYLLCYLPVQFYTFNYGGPYFLRGPRYQFSFGTGTNGPSQALSFPATVSEGDPEFVDFRMPLVDQNQNIYSYFQCADVSGPRYDEDILVTDYAYYTWGVPGSYVVFRIAMNYAEPKRKHIYYVQSMVTPHEQEGPPSEISERIVLLPGEKLTLNTPFASGYSKNRLYRAGTQDADDFRLVDDINSRTYTDWRVSTRPDPIPPFGNYRGDKTVFLRGSILHPNQFGVALYNGTVYVSDQYRFHAWPDEYTIPFPGAFALALVGNTVLVFDKSEVFGLEGGNPKQFAKYSISKNHPLLNAAGLCRIGNTAYWPTHEGLAACDGRSVKIVTEEHFTREQWADLNPETLVCRTADNSIFLERADAATTARPYTRIDLRDKIHAVTTYTSLTAGDYRWHSKRFYFDLPTIMDYVRVVSDGPVTVKVYADRELVQTLSVNTDEPIALNSFARTSSTRPGFIGGSVGGSGSGSARTVKHAREWSFQVEGDEIVRRIEAFERVIHDVRDELRLSSDNTPIWRSTWVRFMDTERWAVLQVSAQTTLPITVRLYADGVLAHTQVLRNGRVVPLPRTLPKANLWMIDVDSPVRVDSLYMARRTMVDAGDGIREINDGPHAPWLTKRYKFTDERRIRSVIVHAASAVKMRLYYDGEIEASETLNITSDAETRVELGQYSSVEFDFDGKDASVREAIIFVNRVQSAGQDGISIVNPPSTRGLLYRFVDKGVLACGSIGASDYSTLRLTLYADGTQVYSNRVLNGKVFALPKTLPEASLWEIDIAGGGEIATVNFFPLRPEPLQGRTIFVSHPKTVAPWFYTRYQFMLGATRLISAWVEAPAAVTMRIYLDGATTPTKLLPLTPRVETLVEIARDCTRLEFDFNGDDSTIVEFGLFGRDVKQASLEGIQEGDRQNFRKLAYRFPDRAEMAVALVGARSYTDVRLTLLADGRQVIRKMVEDAHLIKLPRKRYEASLWEVDVEAPTIGVIDSMVLLPRRGVETGEIVRVARSGSIPRWLFERYEFAARTRIRSVIVDADEYPVQMRLYYDNSLGASKTVTISNAREVLIGSAPISAVEFDFADDSKVRDVALYPIAEQATGAGGIQITDPDTWRGLTFKFPDRGTFAAAAIGASTYASVNLALKADGTQVYSEAVANGTMFQLPRTLPRATQWTVDVNTAADVTSIILLPWERTPVEGNTIRLVRQEAGVIPWLYTRYQFPNNAFLGGVSVTADEYPVTLRLFPDGATDPVVEIDIPDAREVRIPDMGLFEDISFDFNGADASVLNAFLYVKKVQDVSGSVFIGGSGLRRNQYRFAEPSTWIAYALAPTYFPSEAEPAYIHFRADGVPVHIERVADLGTHYLPTLPKAREWEIDLEVTGQDPGALNLFAMSRVQAGALSFVRDFAAYPPWLTSEFTFETPYRARSVRVAADCEVPIDFYVDGATRPLRYLLAPNVEQRLDGAVYGHSIRFNFAGQERHVRQVQIFREEVVPVESGAVVIRPADSMPAWRNKLLQFKDSGSWSVGRLVASDYTGAVVRLLRNNVEVEAVDVTGPDEFKFKRTLPNGKEWQLDVECAGIVHELILFARNISPIEQNRIRLVRAEEPYTWLGRQVIAESPVNFSAARVHASHYPVRIRLSGNGQRPLEVLAHDAAPFRLPRARPERLWEIDAEGIDEGTVIHELAIATSMVGVGNG